MGSSTSKAAKTASKLSATNTARKYPTRSPLPSSNITNAQPPRPTRDAQLGPIVHLETSAASSRDQAIQRDASDPDLAHNARMRQLGPVTPQPIQSNSSTFNTSDPSSSTSRDSSTAAAQFQPSASSPSQTIFPTRQNPAVSLLTARYRLAEEAEREFAETGRKGAGGRQFLDVVTVRQVLVFRERGVAEEEIEKRLGLKKGVVGRLGGRGVVGVAG